MIELGFDFVVISSDARLMATQAQQILADMR
jgi:2-keto-3-deoxy-L-rhamnonate aldolase RhmA